MSFDEMSYKIASQTVKWDTLELKWTLNNYAKGMPTAWMNTLKLAQVSTLLNVTPIDFVFVKDEMETMNYWSCEGISKANMTKVPTM